MPKDITIAITSCGRYSLLKKTIKSIEKTFDISRCNKIISEDTTNIHKLRQIKYENKKGFLQGWNIVYTGGVGKSNSEKHFHALKILYSHINTKYVFHCEDDWLFCKKNKTDYLDLSRTILENNENISIVQLRNFKKDGGFNKIGFSKKERKNELFKKKVKIYQNEDFYIFRNDSEGDSYLGFSLNPGLRRTQEMKNIMFLEDQNVVDEIVFGKRLKKNNSISICLKEGICRHIGTSYLSTKLLEKGSYQNIRNSLQGTYDYRIKFIIWERMIQKNILILYIYLEKFFVFRYIFDVLSYSVRRFTVKDIKLESLVNKEGISEMNIPLEWFREKKNRGISGVARLKNSEDFLEKVILSHEPYLDEIILVDNNSNDSTLKICKKLAKEFPQKIKIYSYNYDVFPPGSSKKPSSDSIHSLAYYYNWCFSKSTKSHVMKLDDDNLLIDKKWKALREKSLNSNSYECYWGYNLYKLGQKQLGVNKTYLYSGKYGDHGIYPVSKKTYYVQGEEFELFKNNLFYRRNNLSFFHLKFIKENFGMKNLDKKSTYYKKYKEISQGEITLLQNYQFTEKEKEFFSTNTLYKQLGEYL